MLTDYKKKANPTEYRGIRFDSKSEAIFARVLDSCGCRWDGKHPVSFCGHDWDFLVWSDCLCELHAKDQIFFSRAPIVPCFIELKPKKPSKTYLDNLGLKLDFDRKAIAAIVYGNPYEKPDWVFDYPSYYKALLFHKGEWVDCLTYQLITGFNEHHVAEALDYRFDLSDEIKKNKSAFDLSESVPVRFFTFDCEFIHGLKS